MSDDAKRLADVTPGGAQTLSKRRARFPAAYPTVLARGQGSRVWDEDGRVYLDWICSLGAISLGYPDTYDINAAGNAPYLAAVNQAALGSIFSLPTRLEGLVSERLCAIVPCGHGGMVRWMKTGSEACAAAVRVARAFTGRDVVLTCGYHGYFAWYAATREYSPGVPYAYGALVRPFHYNDLSNLDAAIEWADTSRSHTWRLDEAGCERIARKPGVAAIILEPTLIEPPAPGFLEGVRERATRIGAVLVFDETVTGGRWAPAGGQEYFGVVPDIAVFGKAIGGGFPVSALIGRRDIMRHAVLISGTFGGDCIGLAATDATLARYQQGGVCEHMWRIGQALMDGYNALAKTHGVPTRMVGQAPHPVIRWDEVTECWDLEVHRDRDCPYCRLNRHRASLFFQETVKRGILLGPDGNNVMLAMTSNDVTTTLTACGEAMEIVAAAIANGTVRQQIEGDPIDPSPAWRVTQ